MSVFIIAGHALRFLARLEDGLRTISDGDYKTEIVERGAPEFRMLAHGFNRMAKRLNIYAARNEQLQEQLIRVQEEERAEIVRDLHDEVGPYLFAIGVDADAIPNLVGAKKISEVAGRAAAIREAVAHVQKHIRVILRQLRPIEYLDFGLGEAVRELIAFWRRRYPDIRFHLDIAVHGAEIDRSTEEAAYCVVRESISNAVRHARPQCIGVAILCPESSRVAVEVVDDGDGLPDGPLRAGMGLAGMAARVRALHGEFDVGHGPGGRGVRVIANLPLETSMLRMLERTK